jgi:hypothetical protein
MVPKAQTGKYNEIGVYQLSCQSCLMKYVGQTGRSFEVRMHSSYRSLCTEHIDRYALNI